MGLILEGQPRVVSEFEAGGVAGSGSGIAKGSGYPILAPVMDLVEVGVGGGSIACPSFLRALTRQTVVDSRAAESLGGSGGGEIDGLTARMSRHTIHRAQLEEIACRSDRVARECDEQRNRRACQILPHGCQTYLIPALRTTEEGSSSRSNDWRHTARTCAELSR